MKIRYLSFIFFLFISLQIQAVHFSNLDGRDGLAHPSVLSIAQDSLGRMWFGTAEGISVYDGNKITSYKPNSGINGTPLFQGSFVGKIVCSANGDIFFKTNEALVRYDIRKGTFQTIFNKGGIALYCKQGVVWAAIGYELYCWDEKKQELVSQGRLSTGNVIDFIIDDKGGKWFTYYGGLLYTNDNRHYTPIIKKENARSLFLSSKGDIWMGSFKDGLFRIQPDGTIVTYNTANSSSKGLNDNDIRGIFEDKKGDIWFGTFTGLYKYNLRKDTFSSYIRESKSGSISHSSVHPVFIDKEEVLWVGTYFGGVNYVPLYQDPFVYYNASSHPNSLSNPVVGCMVEDSQKNIWICTEGGGLNMLNSEKGEIKRFETSIPPYHLPHTNLKSILYDSKSGLLYIGTNGRGLFTYDIKRNKFEQQVGQDKGSVLNIINAMVQVGENLFLSANKGIYVYSLKTKKVKLFCNTKMYANTLVDAEQHLWIAMNEQICKFDIKSGKQLIVYDLRKQGIVSPVKQIFESSRKEIYITTSGNGVMKLNRHTNRFESFPSASSSVLSNYCYRITQTPTHDLVITGDKGIVTLNEEGNILQTLPIDSYFPLDAFTQDCGLLVSQEGKIYIGGTNGLVATKKRERKVSSINSHLYFTELYVHNNLVRPNDPTGILSAELPYSEEIWLSHDQNRIEISFSSYTLVNNQRIYKYRLKGLDKTWYETSQRSVSYTNLPSGNYTLEVQESNELVKLTPKTAQLKIIVLPPWYASWWAWMLWTALLLAGSRMAYSIIHARKKLRDSIRKEQMEKQQIKEIDEDKFKFFTSVSHEFRTPLTLIIGQLEVLLQSNNLAPLVNSKLGRVIQQCRQLNNLVTELIEFRKYEQGHNTLHVSSHSINRYVAKVYDGFQELAFQQNIQFKMNPCEEETEVWFDGKQMIKVIYNLLSNAFKYTPKNGIVSIGISVDELKDWCYISVADSGVGIKEKDIPYIFERFYQADNEMPEEKPFFRAGIGLALVKSIVEEHRGSIHVKSQTDQGSTFIISLQLGKEHLLNDSRILFKEDTKESYSLPLLPKISLSDDEQIDSVKDLLIEGERPIIVLAEDNMELLEILINIFSPLYITKTATNGQEALELIREVNPNLVVSDIMMPVMTGTELCTKIKKNIELCHIPVILLTALDMPEQHLKGLLHGADDYIYKPFSPQILLARCNNMIRSRRILYKQFAQKAEADLSLLATNNLDKEFLDKITVVIDENISNPDFCIDQLAKEMYMGRTSFYNKFKGLTGMSPNDFIISYKLKQAAILLKQENPPSITEISDNLGFNTPNYFSRKFKEQFDVAPSQFKQKGMERKEK